MLRFVFFFSKNIHFQFFSSFFYDIFHILIHYINSRCIPMIHYKCCYLSKSKNFNTKLNYNVKAIINVSTFVLNFE